MSEPMHRIDGNYKDWTACGRYIIGQHRINATKEMAKVTCLACSHRRLSERDEEARAEKQSK